MSFPCFQQLTIEQQLITTQLTSTNTTDRDRMQHADIEKHSAVQILKYPSLQYVHCHRT